MNNEIGQLLNPTGVFNNHVSHQDLFKVYPNPTQGDFTVKINDPQHPAGSVAIYNAVGAKVWERSIDAGENLINIRQDYSPGLYMVRTRLGNETQVQRLIIRRKAFG